MRYVLCLLVGVAVGSLAVYFALQKKADEPQVEPQPRAEPQQKIVNIGDELKVEHKRFEMDGRDVYHIGTIWVRGNFGEYGIGTMATKSKNIKSVDLYFERKTAWPLVYRVRVRAGGIMVVDTKPDRLGKSVSVTIDDKAIETILDSEDVLVSVDSHEFQIDDNAKRPLRKAKEVLAKP